MVQFLNPSEVVNWGGLNAPTNPNNIEDPLIPSPLAR